MLHVRYYPFDLEFEYPFTIAKGTKTKQSTLIVSLGLGQITGYGEAPAISYYYITVPDMIVLLEEKIPVISRYALTDPQRFWHFLEHLIPGNNFLVAALDIAGWDLFARLRRQPLYKLLGLKAETIPVTDYTIGHDTAERMVEKLQAHPAPVYKIKMRDADDIDLLIALRAATDKPFRVDANEGFTYESFSRLLPELQKLGVTLVEQPLRRTEWDAMKQLKQKSPIPLFADESCITEDEVRRCSEGFHGINIKLTKCGGITPALRMVQEARSLGLKLMIGSMNESSVGSAAAAHLQPLMDEADIDGPLLLRQDVATGFRIAEGRVQLSDEPGLGVRFTGLPRTE